MLRWALPGEASVAEAATVGLSLAQPSPRIPSGEHEHRRTRWRAPRRGAPASQGWPSEGYPGEQDPRVSGRVTAGPGPARPAPVPARPRPEAQAPPLLPRCSFWVPEICPPRSSSYSFPLFLGRVFNFESP